MGGWGCPHEVRGECQRVLGRPCEPGMKGCILAGRFLFSDAAKNTPRVLREKGRTQAEETNEGPNRRRK
jgi:hypothetical protein